MTVGWRNLLFALLGPGVVMVLVPFLIIRRTQTDVFGWWGLLPMAAGAGALGWCIRDFAVTGRGTLAPIDPCQQLVVTGLYRYVRNPMYLGVLLVLLGEAAVFGSRWLLGYAGLVFGAFHAMVVGYEERALRRRFGAAYEQYCQAVQRWWPGRSQ